MIDPGVRASYTLNRSHVIAPVRQRGDGIRRRFWTRVLRWTGWKLVGDPPEASRFIMIVAPHTSNWEMPIGLIVGFASGILGDWPYGFMMKDIWFKGPLGRFMRGLGGLPIDRSRPREVVPQMAQVFAQRKRFILAITPEGTRRRTEFWKSGFYHIALAAEVPVVPVSFDYRHKEVGLGKAVAMTGDKERDLAVFREFFRDVAPRNPDRFGPVRFRE
jgi:1-acyl-sn-glycerol-3-phosphate acyltransferase